MEWLSSILQWLEMNYKCGESVNLARIGVHIARPRYLGPEITLKHILTKFAAKVLYNMYIDIRPDFRMHIRTRANTHNRMYIRANTHNLLNDDVIFCSTTYL